MKQWQRESTEKIRGNAYILLHIYKKLTLYLLINKLTLSIMCVKDIIVKKTLIIKKTEKMRAKTENYFLYHQCVPNLYKSLQTQFNQLKNKDFYSAIIIWLT